MQPFDIIVIGAGPGGYVAAIRAAQLGLKTAIVERENLGGICLNWGCIPTKALLRSADLYRMMLHADQYGLKAETISFDFNAIIKRSRKVAARLNGGVKHLLKKNKVTVFDGTAKLAGGKPGARQVTVETKTSTEQLTAKTIILATGARARELPQAPANGKLIWNYRHALNPPFWPKRLAVIGSGAIGVEFSSFFNAFGAEVTIIEMLDRIVPAEDKEISALAAKAFKAQGQEILTSAKILAIRQHKNSVTIEVEHKGKPQNIEADAVISAIGIVGNVEDLGLEQTAIKVEKTHIVTDPYGQTTEPGIYAIGDVAGAPWLAHKAEHEGVIAVEHSTGRNLHPIEAGSVPGCTYTNPQIASIGMSEQAALDAGRKVKIGRFPFLANGKAIAMGEDQGLIKTIFDAKTGELLGAHMIGTEVTELIQGYVIARKLETTEAELMHTIFPHPTLSEMMHEAVLDAYGQAIHI
ncbi:MAG: dihydrolipoyl dehydrogenase [Pseudomonadota bacterium]